MNDGRWSEGYKLDSGLEIHTCLQEGKGRINTREIERGNYNAGSAETPACLLGRPEAEITLQNCLE